MRLCHRTLYPDVNASVLPRSKTRGHVMTLADVENQFRPPSEVLNTFLSHAHNRSGHFERTECFPASARHMESHLDMPSSHAPAYGSA
ncbi:hypothetical protein M8818_000527 [Zalaria obscura]|uniref:Uncharacterized protein n=1 Tax=Zalaria obscura TaxID=2024903 RepID=A0ACC3SPA2_9PEZI